MIPGNRRWHLATLEPIGGPGRSIVSGAVSSVCQKELGLSGRGKDSEWRHSSATFCCNRTVTDGTAGGEEAAASRGRLAI